MILFLRGITFYQLGSKRQNTKSANFVMLHLNVWSSFLTGTLCTRHQNTTERQSSCSCCSHRRGSGWVKPAETKPTETSQRLLSVSYLRGTRLMNGLALVREAAGDTSSSQSSSDPHQVFFFFTWEVLRRCETVPSVITAKEFSLLVFLEDVVFSLATDWLESACMCVGWYLGL